MFENWFKNRAYRLAKRSGKIPTYIIKKDGRIQLTFQDPSDTDEKAYDRELLANQQIFVEDYANPVKPDISQVSQTDPRGQDVKLMPSSKYKQFMKQKIMAEAMSGGGIDDQKMMYLTMANLGLILLFGVIGLAIIL